MNSGTILYRQVHSRHIVKDRDAVSSAAFMPEDRRRTEISTYNGDMITAEDAVQHYRESTGLETVGVVGLTVAVFEQHGLTAKHDGLDFEQHVTVSYPVDISQGERRRRAQSLAKLASWYART